MLKLNNDLMLKQPFRKHYSKQHHSIIPITVLMVLILPLRQTVQGGTITGVVYRRSSSVEVPVIDRYAGRPDILTGHSHQKDNRAIVYLTSEKHMKLKLPDKSPQMEQINKAFKPWLLSVTVGTTVDFPNNDPLLHNVFSYSKTKKFDLGRYRQGKYKSVTFDRTGLVKVFCEIHKNMRAYILVLDSPYHAVTNEHGSYRLENVPAGEYTLRVWQENLPEYELKIVVPEEESLRVDIR